jgi:hypothetical protein
MSSDKATKIHEQIDEMSNLMELLGHWINNRPIASDEERAKIVAIHKYGTAGIERINNMPEYHRTRPKN